MTKINLGAGPSPAIRARPACADGAVMLGEPLEPSLLVALALLVGGIAGDAATRR